MVLTRRAARVQNSIVRWLPNEILADIISHSSRSDLLTLCRTSRLFRNIATRLLYRTVSLATPAQMMAFLRTMESIERRKRLSDHVREFSIADIQYTADMSKRTAKSFTSVLSHFHRLESLDLLLNNSSIEFTDMLDHAHFENLSKFRYAAQSHSRTSLPSFLNRHPSIINLTLHANVDSLQRLDAIRLPDLTIYNGPSLFLPFFSETSFRSITEVSLILYGYDDDIDTALMRLAPMTALQALSAIVDDIKGTAFLAGVARHMPRIEILVFRAQNPAPISPADTLEIPASLRKLPSLLALGFVDDHSEHGDDCATVVLWGGACESLESLILHETTWQRTDGRWESTSLSAQLA